MDTFSTMSIISAWWFGWKIGERMIYIFYISNLHQHEHCSIVNKGRHEGNVVAVENLSTRKNILEILQFSPSPYNRALELHRQRDWCGRVRKGNCNIKSHDDEQYCFLKDLMSRFVVLSERSLTMQRRSPDARLEMNRTRIPRPEVTKRVLGGIKWF